MTVLRHYCRLGYKKKLIKAFSHVEPHRLRLVVLTGFFLVSVPFLALQPSMLSFPSLSLWLSVRSASTSVVVQDEISSQQLDSMNANVTLERKPVCDFSDERSNVCEMTGSIRVHGNSSSIVFVSSQLGPSERFESWRIKPYARKGDTIAMSHIREMTLRSLARQKDAAPCTVNHSVSAIIFSTGGYMGNMFHDFTDILIPLFINSHQFHGDVQFLVSQMNMHWIIKYGPILKQLSRYEIIDFDKDDSVHCFPHAIVGLRTHKEMSIDPSRAPNGYSMTDFGGLLRSSFSLEKESAIRLGANANKRPRLLIIARKRTRSFTNVAEIARLAVELGYEAVVAEAEQGSDLAKFAHIVNSCDVMMGVHGAGLTNFVFLPINATLIQIVPLGKLETIAWTTFGGAVLDMKLNYLQYDISVEESTLIEQYPRDHPVLKDPESIHKQGWTAVRDTYLVNQNVKLDVERFRFVLLEALQLLHH